MKTFLSVCCLLFCITGCAQNDSRQPDKNVVDRIVGGRCEGCEAIHESPIPFQQLPWQDTLPGFDAAGPVLVLEGVVYHSDGITPAPGVILYVYHTNRKGIYPTKGGEKGWARRHGFIRTWLRTDHLGRYRFVTVRPASYPNSTTLQHIHITVKEPSVKEYWIDDFIFADDPMLQKNEGYTPSQRGGSGLVQLVHENEYSRGVRDIILGKNIPGY